MVKFVTVYEIILSSHLYLVNCEWGEWKKGKCSKECGGKRHDTRDQEGPMYGGNSCSTNPGHERIVDCCDGCPGKKCPGNICFSNVKRQAFDTIHISSILHLLQVTKINLLIFR